MGCFAAVLNAWGLLVLCVAKAGDVGCPGSGEGAFSDHFIFCPASAERWKDHGRGKGAGSVFLRRVSWAGRDGFTGSIHARPSAADLFTHSVRVCEPHAPGGGGGPSCCLREPALASLCQGMDAGPGGTLPGNTIAKTLTARSSWGTVTASGIVLALQKKYYAKERRKEGRRDGGREGVGSLHPSRGG